MKRYPISKFFACLTVCFLGTVAAAAPLAEKGELEGFVNHELESGVYTVSKDYALQASDVGGSGLCIASGAEVILYFKNGSTLSAAGKAGSGQTGSGAGILLPSGAMLMVTGSGKLMATGAKGVNGSDGAAGGSPYVAYPSIYAGRGGDGGSGGGGAGAAIGSAGAQGGLNASGWAGASVSGENSGAETPVNSTDNVASDNGKDGQAAGSAGTLAICGSGMTVVLAPGAAGTEGTAGSAGTAMHFASENNKYVVYARAGAPGKGGLGGLAAQAYGTGGGGGGGGASGAGGYLTWQAASAPGEGGAVGEDILSRYAANGANGTAAASATCYTYGSPSMTVDGDGTISSQAAVAGAPGCYTLTFSIAGTTLTNSPAAQMVVYGQSYTSIGTCYSKYKMQVENWHDKDGNIYFDQDGKPTASEWTYAGDLTLYPKVQGPAADTGISINGTRIDTDKPETLSGTGWNYDSTNKVLTLTGGDLAYALSGTNRYGQVAVSVQADSAICLTNCYLSADSDLVLPGILSIAPGVTATLTAAGTCNLLDASLASGAAAIYCPTGAALTVVGNGPRFTYTAPESMTTNLGVYAYANGNRDFTSAKPCLEATTQDATVIGGSTKAIPFSGYLTFTNCIVKVTSAQSGVRGIGAAGSVTNRLNRLIRFYRGIEIQGSTLVYPRPHDEYDLPLYYRELMGDSAWLPAGDSVFSILGAGTIKMMVGHGGK